MWDRQSILSLATSVVVACVSLGILVGALAWSGWKGILGLLAVVGGFLLWYYGGPRPDLRGTDWEPAGDRTDHD